MTCTLIPDNACYDNPVSYTHLDVYKRQAFVLKQLEILGSFSIHLFVVFIRTLSLIHILIDNLR